MKNILVICSGISHGNTDHLCDAFINGVMQKGHQVQKININHMMIKGCRGCQYCQDHEHQCVIKDDMQRLYPLFEKYDTLVLASPLFFWSISGILKSFIDRLYAISTDDKYPQKDTLLLMSSGDEGFYTFEQAVSFYRFYINALGWQNKGMCLAGGCKGKPGDKYISDKYLKEAYDLGKSL